MVEFYSRSHAFRFFFFFFFFFFLISLIADGPHHYHPACGHKGSSHLSLPGSRLTNFYRDASSALLQLVNQWLRKKEHKSYFGKNRTHDFRISRCAGYLLDHSGDQGKKQKPINKYLVLCNPTFDQKKVGLWRSPPHTHTPRTWQRRWARPR